MRPTIRPERAEDVDAVGGLLRRAFADAPVVATLAHRLRTDGLFVPAMTFVAEHDGRLIGQLMLSRVEVVDDDGGRWQALNLTPLAVDPPHDGRGVASALVHHALAATGDQPAS
jgi:predicted N-acetyltransferase YhbS